ncbi:leukocyte elastase inhibitor-like [Neocloeon triangulifer]|uniref:leukocyte elastase inhibitor-like n=1 Tax=Neocloeon triangulifer TaxID=2078957 RepID=UPI00286EDEA4|nr:leukocyte elastase inhibitor-like [Neocloeon triangulifer]
MQVTITAVVVAACFGVVASWTQRRGLFHEQTNPSLRQMMPVEDYESSDYADKIIFLNRHQPTAFEQISAQSLQRFSIHLDLAIRQNDPSLRMSNVVFSPLCIASVLALVLLAAEGRTKEEVANVLGLSHVTDDTHFMYGHLLNDFIYDNETDLQTFAGKAVFLRQALPVSSRFLELSRRAYNSDIYSLDFANDPSGAQVLINKWVADRTNNKIQDLLPEPPASYTKLILASALYFNGAWLSPFLPEATRVAPFRVPGGEAVNVSMMAREGHLPYARSKLLDCAIVGLPYKTNNNASKISMYVILPNKEGLEHLHVLKHSLLRLPDALSGLVGATKERSLVLSLPRLKVDAAVPLMPALSSLGLTSLFDPAAANLSSLLANPESGPLHVDEVRHRVTLEVTETGTEASAATAAALSRDGFVPVFKVDRPFIFFIYDHASALPIFWGSIIRP